MKKLSKKLSTLLDKKQEAKKLYKDIKKLKRDAKRAYRLAKDNYKRQKKLEQVVEQQAKLEAITDAKVKLANDMVKELQAEAKGIKRIRIEQQ